MSHDTSGKVHKPSDEPGDADFEARQTTHTVKHEHGRSHLKDHEHKDDDSQGHLDPHRHEHDHHDHGHDHNHDHDNHNHDHHDYDHDHHHGLDHEHETAHEKRGTIKDALATLLNIGQGHDHDHGHHHDHGHDHSHEHGNGIMGVITSMLHVGHTHDHGELASDKAFADNKLGIRTVWLALLSLGITSLLQIFIVILSGSVALFADTVHNIGDGLNSVPLLIAFYLTRRVATRRYNYGFAKSEDIAGIFIVVSIAFSAGVAIWESLQRLINPEPMTGLGWVAAAAIIGFVGNELVALLQIGVGRRIGSEALVADGLHARIDGLTSLSVLLAVGGTAIGLPILDPIIGLLIGIVILFIVKDATVRMWFRLMDAIEPEILDEAESIIQSHKDVKEFRHLRMRWMGHRLQAEVVVAVDANMTTAESHLVTEQIRRDLFKKMPRLSAITIHTDPWPETPENHHQLTAAYDPIPEPLQ